MDNKDFVEKVYIFQEKIKSKNRALASSFDRTFLDMLEYKGLLCCASRDDLLKIRGVGHKNVDYLLRIFKGENIESIVKDAPKAANGDDKYTTKRIVAYQPEPAEAEDLEYYSKNHWDNVVKAYESF